MAAPAPAPTTLSPLAQFILQRLSQATGLSQVGILEILLLDAYVEADLEPVGLHPPEAEADDSDSEAASEPSDAPGEADDTSDDPTPTPDPQTARKAILTAAEGRVESFTSADLVAELATDGIHVTSRHVGIVLAAESWPTSDSQRAGVRVWEPLA